MADINDKIINLAKMAVDCNKCFIDENLFRAGIELAQPFSVGMNYWTSSLRIVVLGINPGAGNSVTYKQTRKEALELFAKGSDSSLGDYFRNAEIDVPKWGNGRYLKRLSTLGLSLVEITIGNLALCSTKGDKYPSWMLDSCFVRHAEPWLLELKPNAIILMGSATAPFLNRINKLMPSTNSALVMAHPAHREGHAVEVAECSKAQKWLEELRSANSAKPN